MVRMVKNITPHPGDRYMLPSGSVVEVTKARALAQERICVYVETAQGYGIKPGDRCELTVGFLQIYGVAVA